MTNGISDEFVHYTHKTLSNIEAVLVKKEGKEIIIDFKT